MKNFKQLFTIQHYIVSVAVLFLLDDLLPTGTILPIFGYLLFDQSSTLLVLAFPLILFCHHAIFDEKNSTKIPWFVSSIFLIFFKFLILFFNLTTLTQFNFSYNFSWVQFYLLEIKLSFNFDALSILMVLVISFVSSLVHLFSVDYMYYDKNKITFLSYLNLFTFFMILLVVAGNLVVLFIGWEGVGITSYLLINFWYTRYEANKSSLKAIVINKVGDITLFLFVGLSFYFFGTVEISTMKFIINNEGLNLNLLLLLGVLLFISAVAKSSQLGLHTWLPDAMEGPTPVSALLHAATMVTAGVYLLIRFSFIVEKLPILLNVIVLVGSLTAVFGSLLALVQVDIKKIIAFSTLSQLGYMFTAIGLLGFNLSMFHLVTHAAFKALLFLSAGVIIHALNNEQDIRRYGALISFMKLLYTFMVVGFLALSGVPFLAGFYSKDLIIELSLCFYDQSFVMFLAATLLNFGAFLTTFYSIRTVYYIFFAATNFTTKVAKEVSNIKDLNLIQFLSLAPLTVCSIFLGYWMYPFLVGSKAYFFWLNSIAGFYPLNLIESSLSDAKLIPLFSFLLGVVIGIYNYFWVQLLTAARRNSLISKITFIKLKQFNFISPTNKTYRYLYRFFVKYLYKKFYYDIFLNRIFGKLFFNSLYKYTFYLTDRGMFQSFVESCSSRALTKIEENFKTNKFLNFFSTQLKIILSFYLFGLLAFFIILIISGFIYFYFI